MTWSVTARNTANVGGHQASGTSLTVTLTVTATVAGDLCVVGLGGRGVGTAWVVTPPTGAGFVQIAQTSASGAWAALYASNGVAAGTTSLAFKVANTTSVLDLSLTYGCWPGGSAQQAFSEGATQGNGTMTTSGSNGIIPTISTGADAYGGDLAVCCLLGEVSNSAIPATPTGTGTWTSVTTQSGTTSAFIASRLVAQVGGGTPGQGAPAVATSSGSVVTGGNGGAYAQAIGAFPPQQGNFLGLAAR
jgi:hypothetical protein